MIVKESSWNWKQIALLGFALFNIAASGVRASENKKGALVSPDCALKEYFPYHLENYKAELPSVISGIKDADNIRMVSGELTQNICNEKTFFGKLMQAVGGPQIYSDLPRLNKAEITVDAKTGAPEVSLSALKDVPVKIGRDQYGRSLIAYKYKKVDSSFVRVGIIYQTYKTDKETWTAKETLVKGSEPITETDIIRFMKIFNGLDRYLELTCDMC